MNFCIVEEYLNYYKFMLSTLISIDFIYENYHILIACSEKTKNYILNFPLHFTGTISWLILDNLDDNNIRYAKNIVCSLKKALNIYNDVLYIDCRIDLLNQIIISDKIKNQGIGFISRNVEYTKENLYQKYITNILFISKSTYIDDIDKYLSDNIEEWAEYDSEKYDFDKLKDINKRFVTFFYSIGITLKNLHNLEHFINHATLISTEDFFAFGNRLSIKNISKDFKISSKYIREKDILDLSENVLDLSENVLDLSENVLDLSENKISEEIPEEFFNISALNIRSAHIDKNIIAVNKELYNRMAQFNILYVLLINLKYSNNKIEFIIPKRDGIGIWNRNNDTPGMYELIDMITENNEYFGKAEAYLDYFSFNNFILTDKPSYYWLNNNIRKYNGLFLCNYDNTLESELKKNNKHYELGFYYSDYPKLLEEFAEKSFIKKRYCIEIYKNKIIEYELSKRKFSIVQKNVININTPEEKLNIIAESNLCFFNDLNINNLTNCLALECVPIFKKNTIDTNMIYELEANKNYIIEPEKWSDIVHIYELATINKQYFDSNIHHKNIIYNIFNKLYKYSKLYRQEN